MGEDNFKINTIHMIDKVTGEKFNIGNIQDLTITNNLDILEDFKMNTIKFNQSNQEISMTINNGILFPDELGKLAYMKKHVKTKRLKKKYNKLYNNKFNDLFNKVFGRIL